MPRTPPGGAAAPQADPGAGPARPCPRVSAPAVVCWACLVLLAAAACGLPADATGRVARVYDGDSLLVVTEAGEELDVRVFGIDAPERHQPWSRRARAAMKGMLEGRAVRLEPVTVDAYGRTVARVLRAEDALDVGLEMVRAGHAWVYERYTDDPELIAAQAAARGAGLGLWRLPAAERVPPWEWRRRNRSGAAGEGGEP